MLWISRTIIIGCHKRKTIIIGWLGGHLAGLLPLLLLHHLLRSCNALDVLSGRAGPRPAGAAPRAHACGAVVLLPGGQANVLDRSVGWPTGWLAASLTASPSASVWQCSRRAVWAREPRPVGAAPRACLLYTSPSPRDGLLSRMPSSA